MVKKHYSFATQIWQNIVPTSSYCASSRALARPTSSRALARPGGGREAIMMRTKGTTCERWRSIAPIMRAMVGIARASQMRGLRFESVLQIASAAATAPKPL